MPFGRTRYLVGAILLGLCLATPTVVDAQVNPNERQIRTMIPQDQLVSILPSTPFNRFLQMLDPIFQRVTGKQLVDPQQRVDAIGLPIAGMHFLDAFELILQVKGLTYRETDQFFIIETAPEGGIPIVGDTAPGPLDAPITAVADVLAPATKDTREIKISAILFELNHSRARDLGLDWSVVFGENQQQSGGIGGGQGDFGAGAGGQEQLNTQVNFFVKTDELFESFDDILDAPDLINFRDLARFFRVVEEKGAGETVASPTVSVQSGRQGQLQVGSDVPIQIRDFAGNTVTEFIKTGIIINVTPTLIQEPVADTLGAPTFDFVHLTVNVEKSGSRISASGPVIDRSNTQTEVLLLDGEQTVISGLYNTEESVSRRGIPILKDLPGWFFGLKYIFGRELKTVTQRELMIVLRAEVVETLELRAGMPIRENLLEDTRRRAQERLRQTLGEGGGR